MKNRLKNSLKLSIIAAVSISILNADVLNPCDDTTFNTGSITQMDNQIKLCEEFTKTHDIISKNTKNMILVQSLVNVYPNSEKDKQVIIKAVIKYSEQFKVDPLTLTALLSKESSLRKNVEHSAVFVKIPTKRNWAEVKTAKVRAIGTGGVIYEIWKYELKDINITKRTQLYDVDTNIKAAAMILGIYQNERKQLKFTKTKEESALLRYYGVIRKQGKPVKTYANNVYKIRNKGKK